jgi:transcriptional regulator with XRE-family HTH domain
MRAPFDSGKDFNNIREWLIPLLDKRGLSVERFANQVGVTRAAVYHYIKDTNRPSEQTMIKMCRILGVAPEDGLRQYTPKIVGRPSSR